VPAIVDRETWETVQRRKRENRVTAKRNTKHQYQMRGRATCGQCGAKIHDLTNGSRPRSRAYYHCPAPYRRQEYLWQCEQRTYFRVDQVDAAVWEWVKLLLIDPAGLVAGLYEEHQERERGI
jgi:site-specific DNA recombinase